MAVNNMGTVQVILSARDSDLAEGFKKLGHHMSEAQKQAKEFQEQIKKTAEAIGVMYVADKAIEFLKDGLAEFVMSGIEAVANLHEQAEQFHITAEAAGGLGHAAVLAGLDAEHLDKAMSHLQQSVRGLRIETPEAVAAFRAMGLTADDLKGKSLDQVFGIVADRIRDIPDAADKAAIAVKIFGDTGHDGGAKILAMLEQGSAGFDRARESAMALGTAMSDVDVDKVFQASIAMKEVGEAFQGIKNRLALELAPWITETSDRFVKAASDAKGFHAEIHEAVTDIESMAGWVIQIGRGLETMKGIADALFLGLVTGFGLVLGTMENGFGVIANVIDALFTKTEAGIAEIKYYWAELMVAMHRGSQDAAEEASYAWDVAADKAATAAEKTKKSAQDIFHFDMENVLAPIFGHGWNDSVKQLEEEWNHLADMGEQAEQKTLTATQIAENKKFQAAYEELQARIREEKEASSKIVAISADEVAEIKNNRDALVISAPNEDPRVIYERDVLKYMKQGYDEASARRKADEDQIDRKFFEDPKSDPRVVREVAINREIDRIHDEEADARFDRDAAARKRDDDAEKAATDKALEDYFGSVHSQAVADEAAEARSRQRNREKVQNYSEAMGNIDQINQFFGKKGQEAFWANKAFEVAQATINAWMAYSNTLGGVSFSASPADKQVLAASQLALGMVAVANISSQQPAGSRATGGPVSSGSMYEVNERGPELLTVGGRDYLMMGDQGGHVSPNRGGPGGGMGVAPVTVNIHNNVQGAAPRVQQGPDGSIEVYIDAIEKRMASGIARGDSPTAKAIAQTYNLNRSPGGR